jgi:hypothetical protein
MSTAVFSGTVIRIDTSRAVVQGENGTTLHSAEPIRVEVGVDRVWKGIVDEIVIQSTQERSIL